MTADQLEARLRSNEAKPLVVDVREAEEFHEGHIRSALLQPLGKIAELTAPKDREIVLVCRSGRRSATAYRKLASRGYTNLWNLDGGMLAWSERGFVVETK